MTILSDLTDRYVLESISSRVQTYLGWFYASETTQLVSDVWLERGNWNDFYNTYPVETGAVVLKIPISLHVKAKHREHIVWSYKHKIKPKYI